MVRIGSARISENGTIHGVAGDQTDREVAEEDFYFHKLGWLAFKPKKIEHALALAKAMRDACNNNYIGYDQDTKGDNDRLGVYKWVREGKKIAKIDKPTSADCSGLERGCILEATGVNLPNFNTASEPEVLKKSGLFEPPFEVKSIHELEVGMILVSRSKGHTATITEGNAPTGSTVTNTPTKKEEAGKLQASKYLDASLSRIYKTKSNVALRWGAGDLKAVVTELPAGTSVRCHGYYNLVGSYKWLCVVANSRTGYINEKDLDR